MSMRWSFLCLLCGWFLATAFPAVRAADGQVLYQQHIDPYPTKIIIPVKVGGETHPFTLATFTYYTFFDSRLRGLLESTGARKEVATSQDAAVKEFFDGVRIILGEWKVPPQKVGLADLGKINDDALLDLRGAIGFGLLAGRTLSLDYEHQSLEIRTAPGPEVKDMKHTDLGSSDSVVLAGIQQEVNGEAVQFALDTGRDGYIGLSHALFVKWMKSGLIKGVSTEGLSQSLVDADHKITSGNFTKGKLLDTELTGKPVFDNGNGLNVLEMAFLVGYDLVFDFQKADLFYRRREAEPPLAVQAMLGVFLERHDGKLMVTEVKRGSAADSAGIKVGDQLLRLGDLKAAEIDERAKYEFCLHHAGQTVEVEVARSEGGQSLVTQMKLPPKAYQY